jgi:hypothetical protein
MFNLEAFVFGQGFVGTGWPQIAYSQGELQIYYSIHPMKLV